MIGNVNGLLIVDKPAGMTSHDVIYHLRRLTGESAIGHLGTLDPMATGVLPVLLGKYTRLAQFFGALTKSYSGSVRFGFATDTYDVQGVPITPVCQRLPDDAELASSGPMLLRANGTNPAAILRKKGER